MFTAYKVTGPNTKKVYFGYVGGNGDLATESFKVGAYRKNGGDRGDQMMLEANENDFGSLQFTSSQTFESELDALEWRNNERARNPHSITGPTAFPGIAYKRLAAERPEVVSRWTESRKLFKFATARQAYEHFGQRLWTMQEIKMSNCTKEDMLTLTPVDFAERFGLSLELKEAVVQA